VVLELEPDIDHPFGAEVARLLSQAAHRNAARGAHCVAERANLRGRDLPVVLRPGLVEARADDQAVGVEPPSRERQELRDRQLAERIGGTLLHSSPAPALAGASFADSTSAGRASPAPPAAI